MNTILTENIDLSNFLRYLVFFFAVLSATVTILIMRLYYRRIKVDKKFVPNPNPYYRIMIHMWVSSVVYFGLIGYGLTDLYARFNQPLTWRTPYLLCFTVLFTASKFLFFIMQDTELKESQYFEKKMGE